MIAGMSVSSGRGVFGTDETLIRAILAKDDVLEIDSSVEIADVTGVSDFKDFSNVGVNSSGKKDIFFLDVVTLVVSYF